MKNIAVLIVLLLANASQAVDFNDVKVPFYGTVEVTDGITPRIFKLHYDGKSKTSIIAPPPRGAHGNMRLLGDSNTSEFFLWTVNDPKKTVMTMNQRDFAQMLGADLSSIKENGYIIGKKEFIGEQCTHWKKDVSLSINGKKESGYIEACITDENIPLWGKKDGVLVAEFKELKRGIQDSSLFSIPSEFKIIDMNKLMKALKNFQNKTGNK